MEEINACLTVLSCSKLLCAFSYLLNSVEAKDVKLHVEMRWQISGVFRLTSCF